MSWLIKSNLPEASSKISITVPTVRRVPDVFMSHSFAHEHMGTHTQIYTPRPTVAIQKPKGGENSVSGFQTPQGKPPSLPLIRSLSSVSSRKILQALSFQLIRPRSQMEKSYPLHPSDHICDSNYPGIRHQVITSERIITGNS